MSDSPKFAVGDKVVLSLLGPLHQTKGVVTHARPLLGSLWVYRVIWEGKPPFASEYFEQDLEAAP